MRDLRETIKTIPHVTPKGRPKKTGTIWPSKSKERKKLSTKVNDLSSSTTIAPVSSVASTSTTSFNSKVQSQSDVEEFSALDTCMKENIPVETTLPQKRPNSDSFICHKKPRMLVTHMWELLAIALVLEGRILYL